MTVRKFRRFDLTVFSLKVKYSLMTIRGEREFYVLKIGNVLKTCKPFTIDLDSCDITKTVYSSIRRESGGYHIVVPPYRNGNDEGLM